MPRIRGRAATILEGARQQIVDSKHRVESARDNLRDAQENLRIAFATLDAQEAMYETLEKSLAPQPCQSSSKAATKSASKSAKKAGKKRAVVVDPIVAGTLYGTAATGGDDPNAHCQKTFPGGFVCHELADANVHHLRGGAGYHEFESGARNLVAGAGIQTADIGPLP